MIIHTAARELGGASPLDTARRWSQFADVAVGVADRLAAEETTARYGHINTGRAILALGKHGSEELNPSSDIDIACVYGDDAAVTSDGLTAHEWHTEWARRLRGILADVDDDGFVFRVDFDLRPEGTRGPLVNSVDAFETYYERFGRMWERVALLRMRAVVDVGGVGADVVKRLRPFVFRRAFDARIIDELFGMKSRLTDVAARSLASGVDVKRGVGGIREVEFVAQSLVLLHAGRVPALRELQACPVTDLLFALEQHGLLPFRTAHELVEAYVLLRRVEHAIQLGEDRQSQVLEGSGEERQRVQDWIELSLTYASNGLKPNFDDVFAGATAAVHDAFVRHLGEARNDAPEDVRMALDLDEDDVRRQDALGRLGFADPTRASELVRVLERRRGGPFSPTQRADPRVQRFVERTLEQVSRSVDPMAALARLLDVFPGRAHPALLERLSDDRSLAALTRLLAMSAPLSRSLARLARLGRVDDTLLFALDARRPSLMGLSRLMRDDGDDDEAAVFRLWRAKQEAIFSAALPFMARVASAPDAHVASAEGTFVVEAQRRLSLVAEACVRQALRVGLRRVERRHGHPPQARFAILALGSFGGRELGFFRDLDLAFVYDGDDDAVTDGARPIPTSEWAVRLGQQILWVLTSPVAADPLYPVDTRLRPSGSQGALTTSLSRFRAYHASESALWERQALLRLRPVAGDIALGKETVHVAREVLRREVHVPIGASLADMRERMRKERGAKSGLDLKLGLGGIADIEFAVQGAQLAAAAHDPAVLVPSTRRALMRLTARGHLPQIDADVLHLGLNRLVRVRELMHIVDDLRDAVVYPGDDRVSMLALSGALGSDVSVDEAIDELRGVMAHIKEVSHVVLRRLDAVP
jgi:glutamate-ammonia-ligase adenylyltransferase